MPQIGPLELLAVAAIALLVFGPDKLPDIARSIGRTMSQLRRMADEVRDEFKDGLDFDAEDDDDATPPHPRRDHPNVRATAADAANEPAADEPATDEPAGGDEGAADVPEAEFDPNYDVREAGDEAAPAESVAPGDDPPDQRDATRGHKDEPHETSAATTGAGTPGATPDPNVPPGPGAEPGRPPEQRAG